MITCGASHALDLVCALGTQPGDVALVESPAYHLGVQILRDHPLRLVAVPADEHGLRIDALAATIVELRRTGQRFDDGEGIQVGRDVIHYGKRPALLPVGVEMRSV